MAVTAAKSVMAFRVLTMAVDLCRLTTRTMNVNAGHERTSKARIIHQIQLIRGITDFRIALIINWQPEENVASTRVSIPIGSPAPCPGTGRATSVA
ncbi:glutamate decarboxylase isozyme [Shigella dysenteriae 1617]|nr:glutamate decarboxylase isozyme [Shigella dysenteriae 1617]